MLFLSLLPLLSNIARPDICLWVASGQECLFFQDSNQEAYLPAVKHIKPCNSQSVKDCSEWLNSYRWSQKLNSGGNKWRKTIL